MDSTKPARVIAFFDFDGTLVRGDSLLPFLRGVVGTRRLLVCFAHALTRAAFEPRLSDRRTFIKAFLLRELLGGLTLDRVHSSVREMVGWTLWKRKIITALMDHHAHGHHVVIATGSLDLYLPALLQNIHHDGLICTRMEIKDGVLTGEMADGNCVRKRKAELVKAYMEEHGPFDESWGYGNMPNDGPMLEILDRRVVV